MTTLAMERAALATSRCSEPLTGSERAEALEVIFKSDLWCWVDLKLGNSDLPLDVLGRAVAREFCGRTWSWTHAAPVGPRLVAEEEGVHVLAESGRWGLLEWPELALELEVPERPTRKGGKHGQGSDSEKK